MNRSTAAVGVKTHTGWATAVAATRVSGSLEILRRERVGMIGEGEPLPRFVYHEASNLASKAAADLVKRAAEESLVRAREKLGQIAALLATKNVELTSCALLESASRLAADAPLQTILNAHPLIHAAEGRLYREAIARAASDLGLAVIPVSEREAWELAARMLRTSVAELQTRVGAMRRSIGAPWGADEKLAAAAAVCALSSR